MRDYVIAYAADEDPLIAVLHGGRSPRVIAASDTEALHPSSVVWSSPHIRNGRECGGPAVCVHGFILGSQSFECRLSTQRSSFMRV